MARGKRVRSATKKVPAIAITLGNSPFAFLIGSSLTRNKTDARVKKRMVEVRDTRSARNFHEASFPGAGLLMTKALFVDFEQHDKQEKRGWHNSGDHIQ